MANEFLTSILSQDAATRTNNAAETTKFLEREVKRLQGEHEAVIAQIEAAKQRPDQEQTQSEEAKAQLKEPRLMPRQLAASRPFIPTSIRW